MKNGFSWRYRVVQIVLLVIGLVVLVQILNIQHNENAKRIIEESEIYRGYWTTVYPARGIIYDRNGHLLAGNRTVYETGVDLKALDVTILEDVSEVATALQIYLGVDYAWAYEQITAPPENVSYVVMDKYSEPEAVTRFETFRDSMSGKSYRNLSSVHFQPHLVRSYPENTLAANVLGLITIDSSRRSFGVEENYDSLLSGNAKMVWVPNSPNNASMLPQPPSSTVLILTIDRDIQAAVEQIIDAAIQTYQAQSGTIVVADPKTGEILAMTSTPRIDPNHYENYTATILGEIPYNRAVSQDYEPGSVMKILTMAAALDNGTVQPSTTYNDLSGVYVVGGVPLHNWDRAAWGEQTMTGCLQHSLNVCLAWVATQLGKDAFYTYMQEFGLGHLTGVDLAGEDPGRLKLSTDKDWYEVDLGTNAFGQGVSTTPLQMIMAASAVANNGQMPRPHVLKATVIDGRQDELPVEIAGTPISATTADTLSEMLATSLENETTAALVPGYRLAGKTGTASIPTPEGYTLAATNASFIGWGPVDDPKFIVYVWLEKPTTSIWGAETAAPVFKQVVEKLVVLLGLPPDQIRMSLKGQ